MAYTLKLETRIVTYIPTSENTFIYQYATATIELDSVVVYYVYRDFNRDLTDFTTLILNNGVQITVSETYTDIDTLINP